MFKTIYRDNLFLDFLLDLAFFPLWWYSFGLKTVITFAWEFIKHREHGLGLLVWVKNILTPMFGQTDVISRLISFVMRLLQIAVRGLAMLIWLSLALALIIFWLMLPIVTLRALFLNFYV